MAERNHCPQCRKVLALFKETLTEYHGAHKKFGAFSSAHEGWAVLHEELAELWDLVRSQQGAAEIELMRPEAIQIAAMALRFIVDICDHEEKP